ncbi:hypothetical protein EJB05_03666, partial [Eragrostis curvula]
MAIPPSLLLCLLIAAAFPSHPVAAGSGFDAALARLQSQIGYDFRAPELLRRAMTHASYSRENGRALAVLGLAASQSAAALQALANDHDAAASVVAHRATEVASEAVCAKIGARVGIPAIVRVAAGINASAPPVVCGALRALIGAVAVDANSTDAAVKVFMRLHEVTAASSTAAM